MSRIILFLATFGLLSYAQGEDASCLVDIGASATPSSVYEQISVTFDESYEYTGDLYYFDGTTKPFAFSFTLSRFEYFKTNYLYVFDNRNKSVGNNGHIATATSKFNELSLYAAIAPGDAGGINIKCTLN